MGKYLNIGHDENKFTHEITEEISSNLINHVKCEDPEIFENSKCKIEYQLNIFHNGIDTLEYYNNCSSVLIRMNNLKTAGVETCNIFISVKNGKNKIIISDIISIDFFDTCLNNSIPELKKLWIENNSLKLEIELYKKFLIKNSASNLFEQYKKDNR